MELTWNNLFIIKITFLYIIYPIYFTNIFFHFEMSKMNPNFCLLS